MENDTAHPTSEPELLALGPDEPFRFACGPGIACYNQCCQDLNQALTPFDVLELRRYLKLSWQEIQEQHVVLYTGPATGLPVASLRFASRAGRHCPFVTDQGCSVYPARPTSCRLYPVARAIQRSRIDGRISEHFALLKEPHCHGFEKGPTQTARQWVESQGALAGLDSSDAMLELIALKNRLRPGPLAPEQRQWAVMAFYDLEQLKDLSEAGRLPAMNADSLSSLPDSDDDHQWLSWAMAWLRRALFGQQS